MRRRSVMLDITRTEERRDGWNEDEYFSHKIKESPKWGERMFAHQHTAMRFSNEMLPDGAPKDQEWVSPSPPRAWRSRPGHSGAGGAGVC